MRHADLRELENALISRRTLDARGLSSRQIRGDIEAGRLHAVRRGWYVERTLWDDLWPESRHRAHVLAVARDTRGSRPVFSHVSAAVFAWDLPLFRMRPKRVHVTLGGRDRHSVPDVFRHEGALSDDEIVDVAGILCTSLERTVYDLARTAPAEAAISAADAAMRQIGADRRGFREDLAEAWRDRMHVRVGRPGARGIRRAREIVDLADGRAESPGESVSRLHLSRIGFQRPRLQVPVSGPNGSTYWIDFGLDDAKAFGEFDGKVKYLELAAAAGKTLEQVLLEEKQREDWVRGTTQRLLGRWGDEHLHTTDLLRRRLAAFGIRPR